MDFLDDPLSDAVTYLENLHGIQIEIDQKALEDIALTTDTPVTKQLSGITLRLCAEADAPRSGPDLRRAG